MSSEGFNIRLSKNREPGALAGTTWRALSHLRSKGCGRAAAKRHGVQPVEFAQVVTLSKPNFFGP
jgi:hypothetical protein